MSLSAANSYHMVSELRLLMTLLQDDPMGEMKLFDPSLPPVFDDRWGCGTIGGTLVSGVMHMDDLCVNDVIASILGEICDCFNPDLPPVFDEGEDGAPLRLTHAPIDLETLLGDARPTPIGLTTASIGTCVNLMRFRRVLPRQWKAQELGQFFLKKGRMIRIQRRVDGETNYRKVGNQFGSFSMIVKWISGMIKCISSFHGGVRVYTDQQNEAQLFLDHGPIGGPPRPIVRVREPD